MRGWFAHELYCHMEENSRIWLVSVDLGYGMFDKIRKDFPDRFVNTGAAEQAALGISVGLAYEGIFPVVYSITPFLLYRPFETIRNYVNKEAVPMLLVGSGRDKDYSHDGFSHWSEEDKELMKLFPNISSYWPEEKEDIPELMKSITEHNSPSYLNLRR